MQPSGEVGRFEMESQSSQPTDWQRNLTEDTPVVRNLIRSKCYEPFSLVSFVRGSRFRIGSIFGADGRWFNI